MFDQSFSRDSLRGCVRRIDFLNFPHLRSKTSLEAEIIDAESLLHIDNWKNVIAYQKLLGKPVAISKTYATRLALRRVDRNIRQAAAFHSDGRDLIVHALANILREGVPFRLYRLDVKSFFESFQHPKVSSELGEFRLSNATRRVISELVNLHLAMGFSGLPRGLPITSSITELLMEGFDEKVQAHEDVFFYRRFVDDITIVTSKREEPGSFERFLRRALPPGLRFKRSKEKAGRVETKRINGRDIREANSPRFERFEYLGYSFNVATESHRPQPRLPREVWLDVADSKARRLKTRLIRAYLDYLSTRDFDLLLRRVRHLTSNMSLLDRSRGMRRLVGIHFNYPLVNYQQSESLRDLDRFFQNSLKSKKGPIYKRLSGALTQAQKAQLAKYSFYAGAKGRHFFQMSVRDLTEIQRCWKYAK